LAQVNQRLGGDPLNPPTLLSAMAETSQTFFKDNQPNPWLSAQVRRAEDHARH
jgi:hypothetical protein